VVRIDDFPWPGRNTHFNYAKPPEAGQVVGEPVQLTVAQANTVLQKESRRKLIFPYIPSFTIATRSFAR
jgi:hypothetical protein